MIGMIIFLVVVFGLMFFLLILGHQKEMDEKNNTFKSNDFKKSKEEPPIRTLRYLSESELNQIYNRDYSPKTQKTDLPPLVFEGSIIEKKENKNYYEELFKQEEWKNKRNSILIRDDHRCCYCKSPNNLNVHHKYYLQYPNHEKVKPWEYPDDALITLCRNCHKKAHEKKIKVYYTKRK